MRGRALRIAGAIVAALALAGCDVSGAVDIGADRVAVDLVLVLVQGIDEDDFCGMASLDTLTFDLAPADADGRRACRITGTLPVAEGEFNGPLGQGGVGSDLVWAAFEPQNTWWEVEAEGTLDVTLTLPGPVEAASANGRVSGNTVRFTDYAAAQSDGLFIVARPSGWAVPAWAWAGGGAAAGFGVVAGLGLLRRRSARPDAVPAAPAHPDPGPSTEAPPADDPTVWAEDRS
ncbi:hypothetical protein [Propioniciclava sp.]|uniref:hypothetical protein n=1 Tax=Propioniciclava sp. TaxID=2038686 RepID=UPI00260E2877|nr:hypothetical protein [Propioniciclava sp.]